MIAYSSTANFVNYKPSFIPFISFRSDKNFFIVRGKLSDSHKNTFIDSLPHLIEEHFKVKNSISCHFHISKPDIQTVSSLIKILKVIKDFHRQGKNIQVNWFSGWFETDVTDLGSDLEEMFDLKFNTFRI